MNGFDKLFCFDIETVTDTSVAANLLEDVGGKNELDLREAMRQYHLDITDGKNDFVRQLFHKVVCVSFVEADIEMINGYEFFKINSIRSGGKEDSHEKDVVSGFFSHLSKIKPRIVSFNGRTFDLPVMKYRAMKYNIPIEWFYKSGDKWNSYNQRYSLDWHCDLIEALSDFGSSAKVKIREVCALFGIPCKYDVDGSEVATLYDNGEIKRIRDYCEIDALVTYLIYLRYALHTGLTSQSLYQKSIEDVTEYIMNQDKEHLNEFLDRWNM